MRGKHPCYLTVTTVAHVNLRYVKERKSRDLDDCLIKIQQCEDELNEGNERLEACRGAIKTIEREIGESGASNTNLRENIRVRKLQKDILDIQAQIDTYDVEEAARARRNFNAQWEKRKEEENQLNTAVRISSLMMPTSFPPLLNVAPV